MRVVARSEIKNAPYNPRQITPAAKKLLRESLETDGLVEPLIWNEVTGNLVGGHQRLDILDALIGSREGDYKLTVAVVQKTPAQEKILNVKLNNPSLQGTFEIGKMSELLMDADFSPLASGFSSFDWETEFGYRPEVMKGAVEAQAAQNAPTEDADTTTAQPNNDQSEASAGESTAATDGIFNRPTAAPSARNATDAIKARKAQAKENSSKSDEAGTEYYLLVAFSSRETKNLCLAAMGARMDLRYLGEEELRAIVKDEYQW